MAKYLIPTLFTNCLFFFSSEFRFIFIQTNCKSNLARFRQILRRDKEFARLFIFVRYIEVKYAN